MKALDTQLTRTLIDLQLAGVRVPRQGRRTQYVSPRMLKLGLLILSAHEYEPMPASRFCVLVHTDRSSGYAILAGLRELGLVRHTRALRRIARSGDKPFAYWVDRERVKEMHLTRSDRMLHNLSSQVRPCAESLQPA